MRYLSRLHPARPAARRPLAAACLVFYLLAWIGIPLPAARKVSDSSEPFPCQNHHCGCTSAEQCWTACCCMSKEARLAWAREHGVQPPASVLATLAQDSGDLEGDEPATCTGHCCCSSGMADPESNARVPTKAASAARQNNGSGFVSLIEAQRCRGAATEWLVSGAVLILIRTVEVRPDMAATYLQPVASTEADSPPHEPAVPPPRMLAA